MEERARKLYVTGFGQFADVDVNPTELIVRGLIEIQNKSNDCKDHIEVALSKADVNFEVLSVAVDKVNLFHSNISDECIFIHLGVNCLGTSIQLERF